ncbi:MAG TPA: glycosyltransferase [Anaerolineales bacterium]|nr:glycosyltransferase [Anaerolineales bacterium]
MSDFIFKGKLALQQRVLPAYRRPFFDRLADACEGGLSVFTGDPRPEESIRTANDLEVAQWQKGENIHLLRGSLYLCYQRGLIRWLQKINPDVLIMEANPRYISSRGAVDWMHSKDRPVVGWGLGAPAVQGILAGYRRGHKIRFLDGFDALIAYSTKGADEYAGLGYRPERIFVAPNAVVSPPRSAIKHLPAINRTGRVLFVGRLQRRKRVDLLLQACASLQSKPEVIIVGDGPAREEFEEIARKVYPSAQFVGPKFGSDLQQYFAYADLFVLPGTGGLAVQEAMAAALPVIVAEGDGTQRDLVSGGNGWLVQPGDLDGLTAALHEALRHPRRLVKMGEKSYLMAVEQFNIERMTEVFISALHKVMEG